MKIQLGQNVKSAQRNYVCTGVFEDPSGKNAVFFYLDLNNVKEFILTIKALHSWKITLALASPLPFSDSYTS